MARWVIEEGDPPIVRKDGRPAGRVHDMAEAVHLVQVAFEKGDRVAVEEKDGYRSDFTRKFERGTAERLNW